MNGSIASLRELRDPKENRALAWLAVFSVPVWILIVVWVIAGYGIPLLFIGLFLGVRRLAEMFTAAYIKTHALLVSERQLPELYQQVKASSERLGIQPPNVYLLQQNVWNAIAMKLAGRRLVILLSGAVDSLLTKGDMKQLAFLVGHEIGHHYAGHLDFRRRCSELGGWFPWLLLWYRRRAEFTCDRIGLYCSGSLKASLLALCNMTVGAQLADKVDIDEACRQWKAHQNEVFVKWRILYLTHPQNLWRFAEMMEAAGALHVPE